MSWVEYYRKSYFNSNLEFIISKYHIMLTVPLNENF